jgi:hypothetical protein
MAYPRLRKIPSATAILPIGYMPRRPLSAPIATVDCGRMTGKQEGISSSVGLVPRNALVSSESLLFTVGQKKGSSEVPKPVSMMPTEVNSLCMNLRLLIAFHSLYALLETGLRVCPPEKSRAVTLFNAEYSVLSSPVCRRRIAKYGHPSRILRKVEAGFLCSPDCVAERVGFELSVQV